MSKTCNKIPFWCSNIFNKNYSILNSKQKGILFKINNDIFSRTIFTTPNLPKKVSFNLTDIGEGIREVVIKEWFVNVGDKVSQFDNICEVQSDKASVTLTSRFDGIITKLHYAIDDTALVGKPLIDLETDDKQQSEVEAKLTENVKTADQKEKEDLHKVTENVGKTKEEIPDINQSDITLCIPSVRRIAKENKIDLTKIKGTGKHGRILKEDVVNYLNYGNIPEKPTVTVSAANTVTEPIKGLKKIMVKTMTESLKIPHFVYSDEIKVTKLSQLRKTLKQRPECQDIKLTFMPFFIKAISNALQRYPIMNSSVNENCDTITYHKNHNIGIAMDTTQGLAVPVVKNVQELSIIEIAAKLTQLMESGKKGVFAPEQLTGGTFSVSNIGTIGGTYTKPVIAPPQVSIIAIGATQTLPRFDESRNVMAEEIINLSAAADHRIIDGASMANFINFLKKQLENPYLLFLNL